MQEALSNCSFAHQFLAARLLQSTVATNDTNKVYNQENVPRYQQICTTRKMYQDTNKVYMVSWSAFLVVNLAVNLHIVSSVQ